MSNQYVLLTEALRHAYRLNYEASADSPSSELAENGAPAACPHMSNRSFATCSGVSGGASAAISRARRKAASPRGVPLLSLPAAMRPS